MKVIHSGFLSHLQEIVPDTKSRRRLLLLSKRELQTGVVLVISLIILLLLTLIGLSAMQTTVLEERMAGNLRDKSLAFQTAESALRMAESSLKPPMLLPTFTNMGTGGFYTITPTISLADTFISLDSFWTTNPVALSSMTNLGNNATPLYFIQKLSAFCPVPCVPGSTMQQPYKITVRAVGGTTNAVVILQSIIYLS
jgi:type IV pilus assembly protein PilX